MERKQETIQQRDKRINQAMSVYKAFNTNCYWLDAMVKNGDLSSSEAGYILTITK
jgi:hypothetical protein